MFNRTCLAIQLVYIQGAVLNVWPFIAYDEIVSNDHEKSAKARSAVKHYSDDQKVFSRFGEGVLWGSRKVMDGLGCGYDGVFCGSYGARDS